ncbi:GPI mannosyltransferase 2 [Grifola frondosa]|uniref:GPI mannosyltransferase 2 n=1 Tax=Grifola frondosa TaxID=5627 RepID=A0A1C7LR34_GRIFR|nr:GPI mannosyltransferase 2 [Grifola frondosa]
MRDTAVAADVKSHLRLLRIASFASSLSTVLFVELASTLPLFDSSPRVVLPLDATRSLLKSLASPLLRWDAFHFAHIARSGYVYEHEWAFFPGTPLVMKAITYLFRLVGMYRIPEEGYQSWESVLLGGSLAVLLLSSTTTLYHLTLHHTSSPSIALLASLLSLLPSSPITLHVAAYTEPFFTYLSYKGMLFCARSQWFHAACCFAVAAFPPSIYTYVQAKYWNVGFLHYWSPQQLPNFLISAPVLVLLILSSAHYIKHALLPHLLAVISSAPQTPTTRSPFLSESLAPHAIHALILSLLLLLASHTQIVLRLAASMPFTYWAAARLVIERPTWGARWTTWSVVWGAVAIVLWAAFLPPA